MSTFSGLNTADTALWAAQRAIDVTGQNVANVNTDGYSRQRVDLQSVGGTARAGRLVDQQPGRPGRQLRPGHPHPRRLPRGAGAGRSTPSTANLTVQNATLT